MKIAIIAAIALAYYLSSSFITRAIERIGNLKSVSPFRVKYITKTINLALAAFFIILLLLLLGIEYSQLSLFLSSVFAVIGIALFAQWSILSNITAGLIIFFTFPYRVGDRVKVVDKEGDISGIIDEITLFHVIIRKNQDLITYPNSLILQKAVIKLLGPIEETTKPLDEAATKEDTPQP